MDKNILIVLAQKCLSGGLKRHQLTYLRQIATGITKAVLVHETIFAVKTVYTVPCISTVRGTLATSGERNFCKGL